ncbi:unnamed protein product [Paramecium sonneborni]|uniref:Uncharacterized protein n=1 Tax=Paramecium sonneborni TaxID=65129 RepID=A0A8S1LSB2_9CILI|nr:unnamed protein product [Paramecium sonneborni]
MRSQSPLITSEKYKYSVNFFTPIRNKHISQLSTGNNLLGSPPTEVQQKKKEFIPQSHQKLLEKQLQIGTSNNYYQKIKNGSLDKYSSIIFKSGYEQQEEIKRLNKENEILKDVIKKQQEKLQQFLELEDIIEQNRLLQEKVQRLEKEKQEENKKEESQKIENE